MKRKRCNNVKECYISFIWIILKLYFMPYIIITQNRMKIHDRYMNILFILLYVLFLTCNNENCWITNLNNNKPSFNDFQQ